MAYIWHRLNSSLFSTGINVQCRHRHPAIKYGGCKSEKHQQQVAVAVSPGAGQGTGAGQELRRGGRGVARGGCSGGVRVLRRGARPPAGAGSSGVAGTAARASAWDGARDPARWVGAPATSRGSGGGRVLRRWWGCVLHCSVHGRLLGTIGHGAWTCKNPNVRALVGFHGLDKQRGLLDGKHGESNRWMQTEGSFFATAAIHRWG
ncbi:unnamed protein product [Miscanthus lutarioriparius]|uniref:Uncharacterized protein n=1 Tax=Miscanthus lutarioriparius TaxID=422564 RepID=A0A811SBB6_9POAL|nr:unnamed protein product [Miscanthus lutarioriparius]